MVATLLLASSLAAAPADEAALGKALAALLTLGAEVEKDPALADLELIGWWQGRLAARADELAQRLAGDDQARRNEVARRVLAQIDPAMVERFDRRVRRGVVGKAKAQLHAIRSALQEYWMEEARYPDPEKG